jgi:hypothetical protein
MKQFHEVCVSASEPSLSKEDPHRDTYQFFKAVCEESGARQLVWGAGYPREGRTGHLEISRGVNVVNVTPLSFARPCNMISSIHWELLEAL